MLIYSVIRIQITEEDGSMGLTLVTRYGLRGVRFDLRYNTAFRGEAEFDADTRDRHMQKDLLACQS